MTRRRAPVHNAQMTIDFFNLLDDEGWYPMPLDVQPSYLWADGGKLSDAPVDFAATFDGAMVVSTKIDPEFNMNGLRVRPGFMVPRHHHNLRELIIVFGGEYLIEYGELGHEESQLVGPGEFFISDPGTPYTMTAGPEGVTYIETWPEPQIHLETYWHDHGWVRR